MTSTAPGRSIAGSGKSAPSAKSSSATISLMESKSQYDLGPFCWLDTLV